MSTINNLIALLNLDFLRASHNHLNVRISFFNDEIFEYAHLDE